jgi:peptidoglycan LD-endopeptidase LytH
MSRLRLFFIIVILIVVGGLLVPQKFVMPVAGADRKSYNPKSFWYHPWGISGTHKGVDIFAKEGSVVRSATVGLVVFSGQMGIGGNVVLILGPKWRLHYYAHLRDINTCAFAMTTINENIGTVGTTGNAKGKSPHLHYSIMSLLPYPWRMDFQRQGWKKVFYLNPTTYLNEAK